MNVVKSIAKRERTEHNFMETYNLLTKKIVIKFSHRVELRRVHVITTNILF